MVESLENLRNREILLAILETHIETAEPVGSRALVLRYRFPLSPATIRNVMADLEVDGYLVQPHTSAGRIPSEKAYRFYADTLKEARRSPPAEDRGIREALMGQEGSVENLLRRASRILSHFSHYAGLVLVPRSFHQTVKRIDFVRIRPNTVLVILVSAAGMIQNRLVEHPEDFSQEALEKISRTLNERFSGITLDEMRRRILEEMKAHKADYDRQLAAALELSSKAMERAGGEDVIVEGSSNILGVPEFSEDIEKMRRLFRTFEEKGKLVELLDMTMKAEGLSIFIGSETGLPGLSGVSLVTSTYGGGDLPKGTLGIIGPTRMPYSHVIPLVEVTAQAISERLRSALDREERTA